MLLFELFQKSNSILSEGGNVEIGGVGAERIDLKKISRAEITSKIDLALKAINLEFKNQTGKFLWAPELISNREFLSGSAFHFLNPSISDVKFVKHKPSVGDIDTMVDKDLKTKLVNFLDLSANKQFGPAKLIGYKPNPGGDTLISLWEFNNPPIRIQIDLELVDYSDEKPTEWSKFSHSSDWADLSSGIKGVFHKYLLRALTHKDSRERYIQMKTKLKKVDSADLAFAVTGGVRQKYEPVIDDATGEIKTKDGIPIYREIPAKDSAYVTSIPEMFRLLIGRSPAKGEEKKLGSFIGTLQLIKKYFPEPIRSKIAQAFVLLLFGPAAQQLYRGDPSSDRKEKEIALEKMLDILEIDPETDVSKMKDEFYKNYKVITEEKPNYKRQSIKHIYNPGSKTEMSDQDFLDMIKMIHQNGNTLDGIPINLKVDGAGVRFGKDQEGMAFFMTSRVTNPLYLKDAGSFERYSKSHSATPQALERARAYDHALEEILTSDFIRKLPNDTIVQAEMLFNEMAEHSPEGLKFVNIPYDPKTLGSRMTLVPFSFRKFSTGEHLPESNKLKKSLLSLGNKEIKFIDNELKHAGVDLSSVIDPLIPELSKIKIALASKKKDDPKKSLAKEALSKARQAFSNIIMQHPGLGGKDQLGANIEGLVITLPDGKEVKVTSQYMKTQVAKKTASSSKRNKIAVVTVGSFAGHKGHQQLIDLTFKKAREVGGDAFVYVGTKVGIDDPLPPEVKLRTLKKLYPGHAKDFKLIYAPDGSITTPIKKIEKELVLPANSPYREIILLVGDDRYDGFKKQIATLEKRMKDPAALAKYGGTQDQVEYQVIRTPRSTEDGGTGMSFTYLRNVLKDPNLSEDEKLKIWSRGFGSDKLGRDYVKYLMKIAKKGMGLTE